MLTISLALLAAGFLIAVAAAVCGLIAHWVVLPLIGRLLHIPPNPDLKAALSMLSTGLLAVYLTYNFAYNLLPPAIATQPAPTPDIPAIVATIQAGLPTPQVIEKEVVVEKEVVKEVPVEVVKEVVFTPTPSAEQPSENQCRLIHESVVVETMDHVSTSGSHIHLEYWWNGQPEREVIFVAAEAKGGRFDFKRPLKGWVWEYTDCTFDEVKQQVDAHIERQRAGGANNDGYHEWRTTGLFEPAR